MDNFKSLKDLTKIDNMFSEEFISSGIDQFDKLGVKFQSGQVVLVGSRPTVGKTLFLVYMLYHLWKTNGFPQAFISNDESEIKILYKLFATTDGLKIKDIQEKNIETLHFDNSIYESSSNFIGYNHSCWELLKSEIISLHKVKGIRIFFIDTIQGLSCEEKFNNRDQELGFIISDIKKLAVKHALIFFISSSLKRVSEYRMGSPRISDIRESGAIEEISDTIMLLYRPEVYGITEDEEGNSLRGYVEIKIHKNRLGATGKLEFTFNNKIPRFEKYISDSEFNSTERFNDQTGLNNI